MKKIIYFLPFLIFIISLSVFAACAADNSDLPSDRGSGEIVNPKPGGLNDGETNIYTLTYSATEGGRIEGEAVQTVKSGENGKTVVAVADAGYYFIGWSDGNTYAERQDKAVKSNKTLTAKFSKKTYLLKYKAAGGGSIVGKTSQTVQYGESAEEVTAVANEGYRFLKWSDGETNPKRQDKNLSADKVVIAEFERITLTVRYECNEGMMAIVTADGNGYGGSYVDFQVEYGADCEKIISVSLITQAKDLKFIGWADGIDSEQRQERNVTSDITVRAKFGYVLTYTVDGEKGGKIIGECRQLIEKGADSQPVEAVADEGYVFSGWSDLVMDNAHSIKRIKEDMEYAAYFEPKEKTFKYDYGIATPLKTEIMINRNALNEAKFEIPQRDGYVFYGWYADSDYKLKVVNESGKLMLGLQTLNLETDTLYARWEKPGEIKKTYKILMIAVDKINAVLSGKEGINVLCDYKMSGIERRFCSIIPIKISQFLNEWFEGRVIFEVDTYFTREEIHRESIRSGVSGSTHSSSWDVCAEYIPEMEDIIDEYECTFTTQSFGDFDGTLHSINIAGSGGAKCVEIYIENQFYCGVKDYKNYQANQTVIEEIIDLSSDDFDAAPTDYSILNKLQAINIIGVYFHEFCHSIELRYYYGNLGISGEFSQYTEEVFEYHKWIYMPQNIPKGNEVEGSKLYLLHQAEVDGELIGIPLSYWEGFYN